jgi:hypothetical protein
MLLAVMWGAVLRLACPGIGSLMTGVAGRVFVWQGIGQRADGAGRSSSTVACKIAWAVSKYRWARWSRIRVICRHGIDGCVASRSSGSALTASPISSRRMRTASKISPSDRVPALQVGADRVDRGLDIG